MATPSDHDAPDHDAVVRLLSDPATHGGAEVTLRRTHGAVVFLAGEDAYKIKRPVAYDYMDFSTLAARRAALAREHELNSPVAGTIYRGLVPITRAGDGLELGGDGDVVEWALYMRRFPAEVELDNIAAAGEFDDRLARDLGQAVAHYHAQAPRRDLDGAALIGEVIEELNTAFAGLAGRLGAAAVAEFARGCAAQFERVRGLLGARAAAGHVRRCHGDLHMGNVVVLDGRPVPFDALEFDERLGTMDVLYDLAFLLMDLHHHGLQAQANTVLNRYLHEAGCAGHYDGLAALPLFLALRAGIRAMVAAQRAQGARDPDAALAEARAYLAAANAHLAPPPARLVAVGGLSGSGKSTLAARLAPELGPAPGAVHLRSDLIRKQMLGVDEHSALPESAYSREMSDAVYARLRDLAARALGAGHAVVVDAAHLDAGERAATRALAAEAGVGFAGLWLTAAPEVLIARVEARRGDASDADEAVVRRQLRAAPDPQDWQHVDAGRGIEQTLSNARRALGRGG